MEARKQGLAETLRSVEGVRILLALPQRARNVLVCNYLRFGLGAEKWWKSAEGFNNNLYYPSNASAGFPQVFRRSSSGFQSHLKH